MAKNIVVLADGTGNSAAKAFKTNVWRLYQALDLGGGRQIASFSDGVGTSAFKPFEIIGLALGFGVKRRVLTLYKFICRNFDPGDDIYAFGFSRGAFTARTLIGLVTTEGLVDFKSEEELARNALAAYRAFRTAAFKTRLPWVNIGRAVRDTVVRLWNRTTGSRQYPAVKPSDGPRAAAQMKVRFLGVWDTVAAYGLPIDELTRAVDMAVWPMFFPDTNLVEGTRRARQALSIDDERRTFFPIRWNESPELLDEMDGGAPRLQQVWFAGSHSNVGGGYPDDRLAYIPLCWMIAEAAECGLQFKPDVVADYADLASLDGRIYDSRNGISLFYRYHPRSAQRLIGGKTAPLVDSSVIVRMANGSGGYAPISLDRDIDVLSPLGERTSFKRLGAAALVSAPANTKITDKLPTPSGHGRDLRAMEDEFQQAVRLCAGNGSGGQDDDEYDERVARLHDTIWWRRGLYYVTLVVGLLILVYPFFAHVVNRGAVESVDDRIKGILAPIIGVAKGFLPGFAAPWFDAFGEFPSWGLALLAAFGGCLWVNGILRTRIADRARHVWNVADRKNAEVLELSRVSANNRTALLLGLALLFAAVIAALQDLPALAGVFAAIGIASLAVFAWMRRPGYRGNINGTLSFLRIARAIRMNGFANWLYESLRNWILPIFFLVVALLLIVAGLNKAAFEVANSMGAFCAEPEQPAPLEESVTIAWGDLKSLCWSTDIELKRGTTYEITVKIDPNAPWKDDGFAADTYGFDSSEQGREAALIFYPGSLIKRWWGRPWFQPIGRIGRFGNDEYALEPVNPIDRPNFKNDELVSRITARDTGTLYLYVNDAAWAIPGLTDAYYLNNSGAAKVTITPMKP